MIPQFPLFKNLELSDKEEIEQYTSAFPPYAEYQFITMCCWEIHQPFQLSIINDNLLLKQTNCLTGEYFFSLVGLNNLSQTIKEVFSFLSHHRLPLVLRCIPEEMISHLDRLQFRITEDRDNFDYVYEVGDLYEARGGSFKVFRHKCAAFKKKYPAIFSRTIDFNNSHDRNQVLALYDTWSANKLAGHSDAEFLSENNALRKLLSLVGNLNNLSAIALYNRETMIAFSINDINSETFMTGLFCKADTSYKGVYQYVMSELLALTQRRGIKYLNWEADLGIESLRKSKMELHPAFFLKKYILEPE